MFRYIRSMTDEEMEAEMQQDFSRFNAKLSELTKGDRLKGHRKFEEGYNYIERHSVQSLINDYIRWWNREISEGGNGLDVWDRDDTMYILYKDGKVRTISEQDDDGTRKISVDNIDSIIIDGSWGYAYAGPHVRIYNYREAVEYGKWGYKDVAQRYNDDNVVRLDFDI